MGADISPTWIRPTPEGILTVETLTDDYPFVTLDRVRVSLPGNPFETESAGRSSGPGPSGEAGPWRTTSGSSAFSRTIPRESRLDMPCLDQYQSVRFRDFNYAVWDDYSN